jgi:hypothetical protein
MSQHTVVEAHFLGPRFLAVLPLNTEGGGGTVEIQPTGTLCTMSPGSPPPFCGGPFQPGRR